MNYAPPAPGRWIGSYYRRDPARPEAFYRVHDELFAAKARDIAKKAREIANQRRLENELAQVIDAAFERGMA